MFSRLASFMPLALVGLAAGLTGCFPTPVLTVTPTALNFGTATQTQTVRITNAGASTLTWEAVSGNPWISLVDRDGGGTTDSLAGTTTSELDVLEIMVDRDLLPQGTNRGSVSITSNGGDRTINISVGQATPAQLVVSDAAVDFGALDESASIILSNTGVDPLVWSLDVSDSAPWLDATPKSGTIQAGATQVVSLTADRDELAAGTYNGAIDITSNGGEATVAASMTVPPFSAAPQSISFGNLESIETASLTVTNNGFSALTLSVATTTDAGGNWLSANSNSVMLPEAASTTITLTADPAGVPPGDFTGSVTVTDNASGFSINVPVSISITRIAVAPAQFDFGLIQAEQSDTATLTNLGDDPVTFAVSVPTLDTWLSVSPTSGTLTTTTDLSVTVDPTVVDPGQYDSTITVSFEGGNLEIAVSMARPKPAELKVVPDFIDFGTSRTEELIGIWNDGIGAIDWRVDTNDLPAWLILSPVDGAGIASGTVSGDDTDPLEVRIDRDLAPLDQVDFEETFTVEATGDFTGTIDVDIKMTVPLLPDIVIEADGVDSEGVDFINFAPTANNRTFVIRNEGRGTLFWNFDLNALPSYITGIDPAQGSLESNTQETITVSVDRTTLDYTGAQTTQTIFSNDPDDEELPFLIEVQVPRFISIGSRPSTLGFGLDDNATFLEVANTGDPETLLTYQVRPSKEWLAIFPETGASEGTASIEKDWQLHTVTVDRALLDGDSASAKLIVEAYTIEDGNRVPLESVEPLEIPVTVEAAPLTIENPIIPGLRIPSLVRLPILMRNVRYQPIPISRTRMQDIADEFAIFENEEQIEIIETAQTIKPVPDGSALIVLDYSNSMQNAASGVADVTISEAPNPLQALYERTISQLITELPDYYRVGLSIFNERADGSTDESAIRPIYGTAGEPANQQDELFIRDRDALVDRLANISPAIDNGATPLFPAITSATVALAAEDFEPFTIPFDNSAVRTVICITDGRRTTPPGEITGVVELLQGTRVQILCVGWGNSVSTAPLVQLTTGSGGHFYATTNAPTGAFDAFGVPVRIPVAAELEDWCSTDLGDECDQSIAKDLESMLYFSYVTLNEETNTFVEGKITFDDPNDQASDCIDEQGEITGSWKTDTLNFRAIAGDPQMGQISLRSVDGIQPDGSLTVAVKMEAAPRNVDRIVFDMSTFDADALNPDNVRLVSRSRGGLISDWTRTVAGSTYTFASPDGSPIAYGDFGDLIEIDITNAGIDFVFFFDVDAPLYTAGDPDSKYFTYPDTIYFPDGDPFKATAFPYAAVGSNPAFTTTTPYIIDAGTNNDTVEVFITNRGGSHLPTELWLGWNIILESDAAQFLFLPADYEPDSNFVVSTTEVDTVELTLERCFIAPGTYGFPADENDIGFHFEFNYGSVAVDYETDPIYVTYEVLPPELAITSPDVNLALTGNVIDFGDTVNSVRVNISNVGQSLLTWNVDFFDFPNWLTISNSTDTTCSDETDSFTLAVDRANLTTPTGTHTFTIQTNNAGTETITVNIDAAP